MPNTRRSTPRRTDHLVVLGGGMVGLLTGVLLARDGHRVTLLERDPEPPPADVEACWTRWSRRGVPQFRLPHVLLPRFRQTIETELPELATAMVASGCLRYNPIRELPAAVTGGYGEGDERFEMLTGRRPLVEGVLARLAATTPGLTVRRGVAVSGLVVDHDQPIPHVCGVRTTDAEVLRGDVVIDAAGRRSPLAGLLDDAGVRRPHEQIDDVGYVYYLRDFRRRDGRLPALRGTLSQPHDSVTISTLPADHGNWSVIVAASAADRLMRAARHNDVWQRIVESYPTARHWTSADEATDVVIFRRIEDRWRDLYVDGSPVATGVLSVGDAWACTSPTVGRGASIGTMHAAALRDHLRELPADPLEASRGWAARTGATVAPWWRDTHAGDTLRLRQMQAQIAGQPFDPDDIGWRMGRALAAGASRDPQLLRHLLEVGGVLTRGVDVLTRPGVAARALELAATAPPPSGPSRAELVELLTPAPAPLGRISRSAAGAVPAGRQRARRGTHPAHGGTPARPPHGR